MVELRFTGIKKVGVWSDLQSTRAVKLMNRGDHAGWRLELKFKNGSARVDSLTFENFAEAAAVIERGAKQKLVA